MLNENKQIGVNKEDNSNVPESYREPRISKQTL